jgi:hypothetical protein
MTQQDNPSGQQFDPNGPLVQVSTTVSEEQIQKGIATGIEEERVRAAAAVIELTPQIHATLVDVLGLPVGDSQFRVAREYDTQDAADSGIPDATRLVLYTVLGRIEATVSKSALVAALTVEVPYVAPPEAPQQS